MTKLFPVKILEIYKIFIKTRTHKINVSDTVYFHLHVLPPSIRTLPSTCCHVSPHEGATHWLLVPQWPWLWIKVLHFSDSYRALFKRPRAKRADCSGRVQVHFVCYTADNPSASAAHGAESWYLNSELVMDVFWAEHKSNHPSVASHSP